MKIDYVEILNRDGKEFWPKARENLTYKEYQELLAKDERKQTVRCPDCGEVVNSIFDHIDRLCFHD